MPPLKPRMKLGDDSAGGGFEQKRQYGVNRCRQTRQQQLPGKGAGEAQVFEVAFLHRGGMIGEQAGQAKGHVSAPAGSMVGSHQPIQVRRRFYPELPS